MSDRNKLRRKQSRSEPGGSDISNVLEHIEYGDDCLSARRHVVHGLSAGYVDRNIINVWNVGERLELSLDSMSRLSRRIRMSRQRSKTNSVAIVIQFTYTVL